MSSSIPTYSTPFIGREPEIAEIVALLAETSCRLLTLVGPGGIGKTRLAIEIARSLDDYPDGVYFVPLGPLQSAERIGIAVAQAVNFQFHGDTRGFRADDPGDAPVEQLLHFLREKRLLLALDNFEHLLDGAPLIATILDAAPGVKILTTSREALNLHSERVYHVDGMRFPDDETSANLGAYDALQLFAERAGWVRHDFSLAAEWACAVRICRSVGGMPLAIELATTWLRTLACADIANEIRRNVDFLATTQPDIPPRHRSIRAVFQQSWRMLTGAEQAAYMKLAAFRGGFNRQAAQAVTGTSLLTLAALVDKSLVKPVDEGRYDVHELLRQYAAEQLEASGQADETRTAHSAYYLTTLAEREADIRGRQQLQALDAIDADFENVRVAWRWAVGKKDYEAIGRALHCLTLFLDMRSYYEDGAALLRWSGEHLEPAPGQAPHPVWARIQTRRIRLSLPLMLRVDAECQTQVEHNLEFARGRNDRFEIAYSLFVLGIIAVKNLRYDDANALAEESLAYCREIDDAFYAANALHRLGCRYAELDQRDQAMPLLRQALDLREQIGDEIGAGYVLSDLAFESACAGEYAEAERLYRAALEIQRRMDNRAGIGFNLSGLARLALVRGDFAQVEELAAELWEIANATSLVSLKNDVHRRLFSLAMTQADYNRARELAETFRAVEPTDAHIDLALVAGAGGDYETARHYLHTALEHEALSRGIAGAMIGHFFCVALIWAAEGRLGPAVELLGLAAAQDERHFGALPTWQRWPVFVRLFADLEAKLGAEAYQAAWERGAALDVGGMARDLLAEFQMANGKAEGLTAAQIANQALIDPLTERELEVLRLIAEGLSNQAVADQLYVELSTVKTHINHLYRKLGVSSRTQALARARELGLAR